MFFRRKSSPLSKDDALRVKPVRCPDAQLIPTPDGGAKLKIALEPRPWARRLLGAKNKIEKTFELDALGLGVWNACDGSTSVQQIIRQLAKTHKFNLRAAEVSTVAFLRMLIQKGLIFIPVQPKK